jgi:hypothetical protein
VLLCEEVIYIIPLFLASSSSHPIAICFILVGKPWRFINSTERGERHAPPLIPASCRSPANLASGRQGSAVDLVTSVQAQHRGAYEQNPMLPRHPSAARFAVQSGIESLVWYYAASRVNRHHKTIARIMLGGDIVSESVCVRDNLRAGRK